MLGHLSSRGYAPPAPPRALRRLAPLEGGAEAPPETISTPAPAPSTAAPGDGRNVVRLDDRSRARGPRRSSSAATRPSVATNAGLSAPLAALSVDVTHAPAEAPLRAKIEASEPSTPRVSVETNPSAPHGAAPLETPSGESIEPHEHGLEDARRAAAAPLGDAHALEVRAHASELAALEAPASHAAPPREEHEAEADHALDAAHAPAEAETHHALDAAHALVAPSVNETRLDDRPALSEAAVAVLAAARALAALDPLASIPSPVLVLDAHVGGMQIDDARAAFLELVTRGALVGEAGDDPSGLAPLDASGRTITAARLAPAWEG